MVRLWLTWLFYGALVFFVLVMIFELIHTVYRNRQESKRKQLWREMEANYVKRYHGDSASAGLAALNLNGEGDAEDGPDG